MQSLYYAHFLIGYRVISTPRLKTLLSVHLEPINVIISYDAQTNTDLGGGFLLRCFQKLSIPNIATLRCSWQNSSHTRGSFNSVLSSFIPLSLGAQTISSSCSFERRMLAYYKHEQSFSKKRFLNMQIYLYLNK